LRGGPRGGWLHAVRGRCRRRLFSFARRKASHNGEAPHDKATAVSGGGHDLLGMGAPRTLTRRYGPIPAANAGRFRQDLYYRLRVIEIRVPPLRERREDMLPLARAFLAEAARRVGAQVKRPPPRAGA